MAVRLRVIFFVLLITGFIIAASAVALFWVGNRVLDAHHREELRHQGIAELQHLESILKDAETGQRGFILTGDDKYLEPFNDASQGLAGAMEKVRSFPWVDVSAEEIGRISQLVDQKMARLRSTIDTRRNAGFEAAVQMVQTGEGKQLMDSIRDQIDRLGERQNAGLQADVASSDNATRMRTTVFILCGVLNVGILLWAYRRIAEAFKQRDVALREASMRGFELQQQKDLLSVTLASIGDCVMVTGKDGRITFMNPVAEQLTGWTLAEATGRQTTEVFRIINEHTRQPVEDPVSKVMAQGVIVGLANHTVLIRKDGSEVPIDDSGAPIRDRNGDLCGAVLVFRDFSDRRKAEHELRERKKLPKRLTKQRTSSLPCSHTNCARR